MHRVEQGVQPLKLGVVGGIDKARVASIRPRAKSRLSAPL
jgi:hypothetical protein